MTAAAVHAPEPVEVPQSNFMAGIEVLRGIAASTVVVEHTWALTTSPRFWGYHIVEGFGEWGVSLFFLISGYILSDYFWRPRTQWSARTFWLRRIFRIAPAYYVNVAVLFLFFAPYSLVFSNSGLKQVIANLTFTHWIFPSTASSFNVNGALWTLTLEMTLYLVLPLIAPPMRSRPWLTFAAVFGLGMGYRIYAAFSGSALVTDYFGPHFSDQGTAHLFVVRQFIGVLPLFAMGMLARRLQIAYEGEREGRVRGTSLPMLLLFLAPSIILLQWVEVGLDYTHRALFVVYEPLLVLVLIPAIIYAGRVGPASRSLLYRGALWVGERSYSLYLWHFAIILAVFGRGAETSPPHMTHVSLRILAVVIGSLLASAISYNAIEKPARIYGRRLADRWVRVTNGTKHPRSPRRVQLEELSRGGTEAIQSHGAARQVPSIESEA